jgi:hypothetical protein
VSGSTVAFASSFRKGRVVTSSDVSIHSLSGARTRARMGGTSQPVTTRHSRHPNFCFALGGQSTSRIAFGKGADNVPAPFPIDGMSKRGLIVGHVGILGSDRCYFQGRLN